MLVQFNSWLSVSHPWLLGLALLPLAIGLLGWLRPHPNRRAIVFSAQAWVPEARSNGALHVRLACFVRLLASLCLIPLMAGLGPRGVLRESHAEPPALMIVLDISSSMTAEDFLPRGRLEAAKLHLN